MLIRENELRPVLDIDRDRIREVVIEALRLAHEFVEAKFAVGDDQVLEQLEKYMNCGLSAAVFRIQLGCDRYPDLVIRVDPKRRDAMLLSKYKQAVARANRVLRTMRG